MIPMTKVKIQCNKIPVTVVRPFYRVDKLPIKVVSKKREHLYMFLKLSVNFNLLNLHKC